MAEQKLYEVALTRIAGVGFQTTRLLISYCGSAKAVFTTPKGKLLKIPGIGPTVADAVTRKEPLLEAEQQLKTAEKTGARLLFYLDKDFPTRLKQIPDAPVLLYLQGAADLNTARCISIVGTRNATAYGREITQQIVTDLKPYQPLIVSGLAYGIDIAAHRAALQNELPTIGVMASGLDFMYPAAHKKTAEQMLQQGGLLTEYGFGVKPEPPRFPARNRIIAGLADCTIVVEANAKGGALITAELALDYNREIMAVPGNLTSPTSAGCNHLIKTQGAGLYSSAEDVVNALNWSLNAPTAAVTLAPDFSELTEEEQQVMQVLYQNTEEQIDNLSWKTQIPMSRLASLLLTLEFAGGYGPCRGRSTRW